MSGLHGSFRARDCRVRKSFSLFAADSVRGAIMFLRPLCFFALVLVEAAIAADTPKLEPLTMAGVLARSKPADWRALEPENVLYAELASGRVVIELAPSFAPEHAANVKALAREHYYDGLAIVRAQDNYVVQLADPQAEKPELARKVQRAKANLPPEFDR